LALPRRGLEYQREVEIPIAYDGVVVTRRRADFVGRNEEGELPLETKARSEILAEDVEQCLLYVHQGGYRLCPLVNLGEKPPGVRRFVHTPQGQDEAGWTPGCYRVRIEFQHDATIASNRIGLRGERGMHERRLVKDNVLSIVTWY
jgi:GxxExxY protein